MARPLRPHLPGVAFHITARIQGRAALLAGLEKFVVAHIDDTRTRSDAGVMAYAIMPNHLHLVLRQGPHRLSEFMQPLLTRVALLVQRFAGVEGHVFERRYFASPCLEAEYLRNTIAYVHLNGLRAGLVDSVDRFPWTSHARYGLLVRKGNADTHMENGLRLFASGCDQSLLECHRAYRRFLEWRCAEDEHRRREEQGVESTSPERPRTDGGDQHWLHEYSIPIMPAAQPAVAQFDLSQLADMVLRDAGPNVTIDRLRSDDQRRDVVRARQSFILRALEAGHRGSVIASYLGISHSAISRTITKARR